MIREKEKTANISEDIKKTMSKFLEKEINRENKRTKGEKMKY